MRHGTLKGPLSKVHIKKLTGLNPRLTGGLPVFFLVFSLFTFSHLAVYHCNQFTNNMIIFI